MGVANRIINIAVLLFAIVAVVLASMLFTKREQLVDGWSRMAKSINRTAAALDANSGTSVASKLGEKAIDHTNYEKLNTLLPSLANQATDVIKQRDELADAMKDTAITLEVAGIDDKGFKSVADYGAKRDDYLGKIRKVQERDMGLISEVIATGKIVGVNIAESSLKDVEGGYKEPLNKLNTKVDGVQKRVSAYGSFIDGVASVLEFQKPSLDGDDYATGLDEASSSVKKYKESFDQTKVELASEKENVGKLKEELKGKDNEIAKAVAESQKKDSRIAELNKVIGITDKEENLTIYADGSPEALKLTKGKVVEINSKWDFVVVDVGTMNKVAQPVGKLKNMLSAPIPSGKTMTVARDLGGNPEFIGKIKIVKVYDFCAIANVLSAPKGQSSLQVGDIVYFTDEDLAEAPKAVEAAAAPAAAPAAE